MSHLEVDRGFVPFNKQFNWVLSSCYHRPRLKVGDVFAKVLMSWVPAPARILDPTAGPRRMYARLINDCRLVGADYEFVFGDIEPQAEDVLQMDARELPEFEKPFDAVVVDPPYRRELRHDKKEIQLYRGERDFDLKGFICDVAEAFLGVLKPSGCVVFKIGDNHRKDGDSWVLEDWHNYVITVFSTHYILKDLVVFMPYYVPRWAPKKPYSIQRHSYFLLFEKRELDKVI